MDAAQQPAGAGTGRPVTPRARKTRLVLLMVGGLVALLCLGGTGVAFVAYRDATEPDRSSPDVAVSNYLRAIFVDRNDVEAAQYICDGQRNNLTQIGSLYSDLVSREERFDTTFTVSWGELRTTQTGDTAGVSVDLQISASVQGVRQSDIQHWSFELLDSDGWRVCSAKRL